MRNGLRKIDRIFRLRISAVRYYTEDMRSLARWVYGERPLIPVVQKENYDLIVEYRRQTHSSSRATPNQASGEGFQTRAIPGAFSTRRRAPAGGARAPGEERSLYRRTDPA